MSTPYIEILRKEGFPDTRSAAIFAAMDKLHSSIAYLDCDNLKRFWEKPLEERLKEYAKSEHLRDVTPNGDNCII